MPSIPSRNNTIPAASQLPTGLQSPHSALNIPDASVTQHINSENNHELQPRTTAAENQNIRQPMDSRTGSQMNHQASYWNSPSLNTAAWIVGTTGGTLTGAFIGFGLGGAAGLAIGAPIGAVATIGAGYTLPKYCKRITQCPVFSTSAR